MVQLAKQTEDLQNDQQNLENTISSQKKKKKAVAVRSSNRKNNKLTRVRNMLNRIMMKKRFHQWVASTEYILNIDEGCARGAKLMEKIKLKNNFYRYRDQVQKCKRGEQVNKRMDWFTATRSQTLTSDLFQTWKLYVKQYKMAKKLLMRSANDLDKQLANEGFNKWK